MKIDMKDAKDATITVTLDPELPDGDVSLALRGRAEPLPGLVRGEEWAADCAIHWREALRIGNALLQLGLSAAIRSGMTPEDARIAVVHALGLEARS